MPPELSSEPTEFVVKARMVGRRLDAYLASRYPDYSRSVIQKVIDAGAVLINDQPAKASYRVREADRVRLWLPELSTVSSDPEDIPLEIVFEDPGFTVVEKPAGLVTHPGRGNWSGTMINALQFHFDQLSTVGGEHRPGIVHRLDRDTSGLLIVAKNDQAHRELARQFEAREVKKEYLALVVGVPSRDSDYIEKPIGPHPTIRERMAVRLLTDGARDASTFYEVVERFDGYALVRCHPRTGRTHQIRVHMAHIGHPIVADKAYLGRDRLTLGDLLGADAPDADRVLLARQGLHAHALSLAHPTTGAPLAFRSPLPPDMDAALAALREHRPAVAHAVRPRGNPR